MLLGHEQEARLVEAHGAALLAHEAARRDDAGAVPPLVRISYEADGVSVSRSYRVDDVIWKLEPEKRIRRMLADVQRHVMDRCDAEVREQLVVRG